MSSVLVVEHDQKLKSHLQSFLEQQGHMAVSVESATEALKAYETNRFDIVLCDTNLPGIDGYFVVEAVRFSNEEAGIIVISSSSEFREKRRAFNAGCDDYMVKPIDLNELLLRMTALIKRINHARKQRVFIGSAVLDSTTLTVVDGPQSTVLPLKEFQVLFKLCSSPGRIFSRREIMDDVWDIQTTSNERTVDVHIKRLRERFKDNPSFRIDTVRSVGYKAVALK